MSKLFEASIAYKPFAFPWAVDLAVEHERMHWTEEEIDLADDVTDWKAAGRMTDAEKAFVTQILRMFTQSDVSVGAFYYDVLIPRVRNNEVRNMLGSFAVREQIHQRAYALLNDTLGLPEGDYAAFMDYAEMKEKLEHMADADSSTDHGLALALAKSVFNEGVSLFASFAMLLNFQRFGLMKGMGKVVEWSTKDETKHVEGVSRLFRQLVEDKPGLVTDEFKRTIYENARQTVALEDRFIDLAWAMGPVRGITADEVKQFIRCVADRRLVQLGLKPNWGAENPLPWIDWILNGADHTNFFENRVTEYEVGGLVGDWGYGDIGQRFMVYTRDGCGYCTRAKELLIRRGHVFTEVDLTEDEKRQAFYNQMGFEGSDRTMPKIYLNTSDPTQPYRYIGGYTELAAMLEA